VPHPEPQPEQGGAAAYEHLPADRIHPQLAVLVAIQLDRGLADPEPPRLRIVHRRRTGRGRDQVASLIGQDWRS
jgi:hypothetical protein